MSRPSVVQHRYAPLPALDALAAARPPAPLWRVLLSGSRRHWLATLAAVALLGLVVVNLNHGELHVSLAREIRQRRLIWLVGWVARKLLRSFSPAIRPASGTVIFSRRYVWACSDAMTRGLMLFDTSGPALSASSNTAQRPACRRRAVHHWNVLWRSSESTSRHHQLALHRKAHWTGSHSVSFEP